MGSRSILRGGVASNPELCVCVCVCHHPYLQHSTAGQGSMTFSGMTITIIVAVIVIFVLLMIMAVVLSLTILHFKKREGRVLEPEPAPVYETVAPLQTSPQAASNVELMEVEENAAYASSIIPKENAAYGTCQMKK